MTKKKAKEKAPHAKPKRYGNAAPAIDDARSEVRRLRGPELFPPDASMMELTFSLPKTLASAVAEVALLAGVTPENAMRVMLAMSNADKYTIQNALSDLLEERARKAREKSAALKESQRLQRAETKKRQKRETLQ